MKWKSTLRHRTNVAERHKNKLERQLRHMEFKKVFCDKITFYIFFPMPYFLCFSCPSLGLPSALASRKLSHPMNEKASFCVSVRIKYPNSCYL